MSDAAASRKIAEEMLKRFPVVSAPLPDGDLEPNYQVGVSDSKISLNKTAPIGEMGRLDYTVHVESHSNTSGFVGGVYFRLMDNTGNVVYAIKGDSHGVNGKLIPNAPSKFQAPETKFIPLDVLTAVYSYETLRVRMEGPALAKLEETINSLVKGADAVKEGLARIGTDIMEIAKIIKGSA